MTETSGDDAEIGLLDIAVVIAENWLLLVFVPLLVGALTAGVLYFGLPPSYESSALIRVTADEAAMLQSARVLDPAILGAPSLDARDDQPSGARQALLDSLTVDPVENTRYYRVTLTQRSPEEAHGLLTRILAEHAVQSAPVGSDRARLELRLATFERGLEELGSSLDRLNAAYDRLLAMEGGQDAITLGEIGQSIVSLVGNIETRRQDIATIREQLNGSVTPEDVIQPPTLPDSPMSRGIMVRVILAMLAAGLLMLLFAFIREGFRRSAATPDGAAKLDRIRRAFWLRPKATVGAKP